MNLVTFSLNLDDYDALARIVEKKSQLAAWMGLWGSPILCSCIALVLVLDMWKKSGVIPKDIYNLSTYAQSTFWLCMGFLYRISLTWGCRRLQRTPNFGTEVKMMIGEPGIAALAESGDGMVKWGSITRIEETDTHIFMFLSKKKALIVPKRAFASPGDASAFAALAQKFWREDQSLPIAAPTPPIAAP